MITQERAYTSPIWYAPEKRCGTDKTMVRPTVEREFPAARRKEALKTMCQGMPEHSPVTIRKEKKQIVDV